MSICDFKRNGREKIEDVLIAPFCLKTTFCLIKTITQMCINIDTYYVFLFYIKENEFVEG